MSMRRVALVLTVLLTAGLLWVGLSRDQSDSTISFDPDSDAPGHRAASVQTQTEVSAKTHQERSESGKGDARALNESVDREERPGGERRRSKPARSQPRGLTIKGRVVTSTRVACPAAEIWWSKQPLKERRAERLTKSDMSGRFVVHDAPIGARIYARKRGHSPSLCFSVVATQQEGVELILGPAGCDLEIVVVDEVGTLLDDVTATELRRIKPMRFGSGVRWTPMPLIATSDAHGIVRFEGLAAGKFELSLTGHGIARRDVSFELRAGRRRERVIVHSSGGVRGVLREHNGAPIAKASIACAGKRTRSDEKGRFELVDLPAGEHTVSVRDSHSLLVRKKLRIRGRRSIDWSPRIDVRPVFHLRFKTPDGKPLPKSEVRLVDPKQRRVVAFYQLRAGAELRLRRARHRRLDAWISTHSAAIFDGVFRGVRANEKAQELRLDSARWPPGKLRVPGEWGGTRLVFVAKTADRQLRRIGFGRKTHSVAAGGETLTLPVGDFVIHARIGPSGSKRKEIGSFRIERDSVVDLPPPKR